MNTIHPSAVIGPGVTMGQGNVIHPNAVLLGPIELGDDNWIGPGVVIGTPPEVRGVPHQSGWESVEPGNPITIGSRNVFREGVSVQRSRYRTTTVGSDNFIMSRAYIAHDCVIGDTVTISANVSLAGHCIVQDFATLGLASSFHQFSVVGSGAMVGMGAVITRDVPPYSMVFGVPAKIQGSNYRGMKAHRFDEECIESWTTALSNTTFLNANECSKVSELMASWKSAVDNVHLKDSERA